MSSRPPEPPYDPYDPSDPRNRDDFDDRYPRDGRRFDPRDRKRSDERIVEVRRRPPLWVILAGLVALVLVGVFAFNLARGGPGEDRLDGDTAANTGNASANAAVAAADPAERCSTRQTLDAVKAELFRLAAATRGNDQASFDRLASFATLRMDSPVLKREDAGAGTLVCSGRASIDLPPGLVVAGGRTSVSAALDYALQNAAGGSGQQVTLAGADPITIPLATLARSADASSEGNGGNDQPGAAKPGSTDGTEQGAPPPPPAPQPVAPAPQPLPVPRATTPPPAPTPPRASSSPAFNCRYAKTRGEVAVCNDDGLASLDRRMTGIYVDALRQASPEQYALLHRTRDRFLGYRDRCANTACMAGAYRDRIREIGDIMEGRWQP